MRLGGDLRLNPIGKIKIGSGDRSSSTDTVIALGFVGHADYVISPNLMIGLMPQVLFNVKGENDDDSATQLDLMARLTGMFPLNEGLNLFGYGAGGYSFIFVPDLDDDPNGLVLDLGGGASYSLGPTTQLNFDLGYQLGFQGVSVNGRSIDIQTNFLHFGVGIATRF